MGPHLEFAIDDREIGGVMERFRQIVETTVAEQLRKVRGEAAQAKEALPSSSLPAPTPEGTDLLPAERLKARDLRTALLLGKIPEDSGILIDAKTARCFDRHLVPAPGLEGHAAAGELKQYGETPERVKSVIMLVVFGWNKSLFPADKQPVVEKQILDHLVWDEGSEDAIGVAIDIMDTAADRRKRLFPDLRRVIVDHEVEIVGGNMTLNVTSAPVPNAWEPANSIQKPTVIEAAGQPPKSIEEFVGRVNSGTAAVSIARMKSPSGWSEPGQTPEFDEYTVVLQGTLHVELKDADYDVGAGQAIIVKTGEWVQYSSPGPAGAEYIAVCLPARQPQHRPHGGTRCGSWCQGGP